MQVKKLKEYFNLIFNHAETKRFSVMVIFGLGFSISVILSTIGLMDGFADALKKGLRKSNGDITMISHYGFFDFDENLKNRLETIGIDEYASIVQTESYLIKNSDEESELSAKGILARGVDSQKFGHIVGLDFQLNEGEIAIGKELSEMLELKIGDEVTLSIARGNSESNSLPQLIKRKISAIVTHGVYQKDLRIVYFDLSDLQGLIHVGEKVNQVIFNVPGDNKEIQFISTYLPLLKNQFSEAYSFKPYWREFGSLIEAVQVEKVLIGVVLQVVVVISIFNVLALIMYVNEKRSRDFFLISALGMPRTELMKVWMIAVSLLWISSCFISLFFVEIFKVLILKLSIVNLPPEVYSLGKFDLKIQSTDYLLVFGVAFLWVFLMSWFVIRRVRKKSLLEGLRQEFA